MGRFHSDVEHMAGEKHGKNYRDRVVLLDFGIENVNISMWQFKYSHREKLEFINLSQV